MAGGYAIVIVTLRGNKVEKISLKQLKEENAGNPTEVENTVIEDNTEVIQDEYVEVDEGLNEVTKETQGKEEKPSEENVIESWMQTDKATSEENKGFVPNAEAAKQRRKYKALRDESEEKDDRIANLESMLAQLQSGNPEPQAEEVKPPDLPDDLYDENAMRKYHADYAKYSQNLILNSEQKRQQELEQRQQQQKLAEHQSQLDKSFNSHLDEADDLVNQGKITEDAFTQAQLNVYRSLDAVSNGQGQNITKGLISKLGEGSAKVIYSLGVNSQKMATLTNKLSSDPSGLSAAVYLGQLQSEISTPKNRRSNAPKPQKQISGNSSTAMSTAEKKMKEYQKMKDVQKRISFKRKAKKEGIDVSNW